MSEGAGVSKRKVLACIDQSAEAERVCRQAKKLAREIGAPWVAVHVANPSSERGSREAKEQLLHTFRLAQDLGGETLTLNGENAAFEILSYAKTEGVTHLVLGAPSAPWPLALFAASTARRLIRDAGDITLQICPRPPRTLSKALEERLASAPWGDPGAYVMAVAFVAFATLIALPIQRSTGLPNISLIYVLAVIAASIRYGGIVSAFTAIASALAYNFFLTEPYYSFTIYDPVNVWAVFFFLLVGGAVSAVAAHARAQTALARKQAREALELRLLTQATVDMHEESEIARVAAGVASRLLCARAVVMFDKRGMLELAAEAPSSEVLGGGDLAAARWTFSHGREAGRGSYTLGTANWLFTPARGDHGVVAALGVRPLDEASSLDPEQRRLLDLIANQVGLALDRASFARDASEARVETERARAKSQLLVSALQRAVQSSADGADVQELLAMAGDDNQVRVREEAVAVVDLVDAVVDRVRDTLGDVFVSRDVRSDLPVVSVDRAITEDALSQVLRESARRAPQKGTLLVRASRRENAVAIEIETAAAGDGAGLGTSPSLDFVIARTFLEAEGATLEAGEGRTLLLFPVGKTRRSQGVDGLPARVT